MMDGALIGTFIAQAYLYAFLIFNIILVVNLIVAL